MLVLLVAILENQKSQIWIWTYLMSKGPNILFVSQMV